MVKRQKMIVTHDVVRTKTKLKYTIFISKSNLIQYLFPNKIEIQKIFSLSKSEILKMAYDNINILLGIKIRIHV